MVVDEMLLRVKTSLAVVASRAEWSAEAHTVTFTTTSISFTAWPTLTAYPLGLTGADLVGGLIDFGGGVRRIIRTATDATHTLTWQHPVAVASPHSVTIGSGPLAGAVPKVGGAMPARKTCTVYTNNIATPMRHSGQGYGAQARVVDLVVSLGAKFTPATGQTFEDECLGFFAAVEQAIECLEYHTSPVALVQSVKTGRWVEGDGSARVWCYGADIIAQCEERC